MSALGRGVFAVFARPAVPGRTKTRLAAAVGNEVAAALAAAFFADIWANLQALDEGRAVLATTDEPMGLPAVGEVWLQGEGDLGARVERILRRGLTSAPFCVALGADSPGMPIERLTNAIAALQGHDAAVVPAEDGGFVLLAMRRCPEGALADLPWSSPQTCARTVERLERHGLRVAVLEPWWDVDTPADLERLRDWLGTRPELAPHTAEALRRAGGLRPSPSR